MNVGGARRVDPQLLAIGAPLDRLCDLILADDTLPVPPPDQVFVGDGSFREIGVEFLKWFVRAGDLAPTDRVLDVGCGIGRMALPLTRYLAGGTYDGVDVVADGVAWCTAEIATRHPEFRFHHLDLHHPIYNPAGTRATTAVALPFGAAAFDFVFMTSVVTHLTLDEVAAYAREVRRVMAPGGRLLVTAFLMNEAARAGLAAGQGALAFAADAAGPEHHADPGHPMAAVAFDEPAFLASFAAHGLVRRRKPVHGRWSGREGAGPTFQDISVFDLAEPGSH